MKNVKQKIVASAVLLAFTNLGGAVATKIAEITTTITG